MATALSDLITAIRQRADMVNNQFVTDAEITVMVNESLAQLDGILIAQFNDYKITPVILTASSTDGSLTLPSDFLKLRGVDAQYNANDPDGYVEIREYSFQQRNRKPYMMSPLGGGIGGPYNVNWRLQGMQVMIAPVSLATNWKYRVWYTPKYTALALTTDTMQPYMDTQYWHQYGVYDCCVKILGKQDLDPATFVGLREEARALIMQISAPNRVTAEPKCVVDTRFDNRGWGYGWDW
jgi:hypothetical protein